MSVIQVDFRRGGKTQAEDQPRLQFTFELLDAKTCKNITIYQTLEMQSSDYTVEDVIEALRYSIDDVLEQGARVILDGGEARSLEQIKAGFVVEDYFAGLPQREQRAYLVTGIRLNGVDRAPSWELVYASSALEAELQVRALQVSLMGVELCIDADEACDLMLAMSSEPAQEFIQEKDIAVYS